MDFVYSHRRLTRKRVVQAHVIIIQGVEAIFLFHSWFLTMYISRRETGLLPLTFTWSNSEINSKVRLTVKRRRFSAKGYCIYHCMVILFTFR